MDLDEYKKKLRTRGRVFLTLKIRPNAGKTRLVSKDAGGAVKMDISEPAEKQKANQALIRFFAKELGVPKANISIKAGQSARIKLIKVKYG